MISLSSVSETKAKQALANASKSGLEMFSADYTNEYCYAIVKSGQNLYTVCITANEDTGNVEALCNHTYMLGLPESGENHLCKHIAFVASHYREWFHQNPAPVQEVEPAPAPVKSPEVEAWENYEDLIPDFDRFCTCGAVIETGLAGDKCNSCLNSELFG